MKSNVELVTMIDLLIKIYPDYKNHLTMYMEGYKAKENHLKRTKKHEWYIAGYEKKRIFLVWSYQGGYKPKINYKRIEYMLDMDTILKIRKMIAGKEKENRETISPEMLTLYIKRNLLIIFTLLKNEKIIGDDNLSHALRDCVFIILKENDAALDKLLSLLRE